MSGKGNKSIHRVLARKWRPVRFDEVVGQQHVLAPLVNSIKLGKLHHAYLLTGTRGVGKTSLARILAKAICCQSRKDSEPCGACPSCEQIAEGRYIDLIEVDAASKSKVEETRELIENLHYSPATGANRVYIIDEVHMFSRHSFNSLLKVLEEPPGHVTFILATTDYKKIPSTILSRCLQFHLKHLTVSQIGGHLSHILKQESIDGDEQAIAHIAKAARGSMRDALSLLDQAISSGEGGVDLESTRSMLGVASIDQAWRLIGHLAESDLGAIITSIDQFAEQVIDSAELLDQVITFLQNLALVKSHPPLAGQDSFKAQFGDYDFPALAEKFSVKDIHLHEHIALDARSRLWLNPSGERALKMCFARMLVFAAEDDGSSGEGNGESARPSSPSSSQEANAGAQAAPAQAAAKPPPPQKTAAAPSNKVRQAAKSGSSAPNGEYPGSDSGRDSGPGRGGNGRRDATAEAKQTPPSGERAASGRAQAASRKRVAPGQAGSSAGRERATPKRERAPAGRDLLKDREPLADIQVSGAMRLWQDVVKSLEDGKLSPDIAFHLRRSAELVEEDGHWQLRYIKSGFRNQEAEEALALGFETLKQRPEAADAELTEVGDISINLHSIGEHERSRSYRQSLDGFAKLPVVDFLSNKLNARLIRFESPSAGGGATEPGPGTAS